MKKKSNNCVDNKRNTLPPISSLINYSSEELCIIKVQMGTVKCPLLKQLQGLYLFYLKEHLTGSVENKF